MEKTGAIFDIRTSENALQTLCSFTNVSQNIWECYVGTELNYQYSGKLVEYVVKTYGNMPTNYRDWNFIYFHITTSNDECLSFKKYGILDLKSSYLCPDSELRIFLDNHNIHIDLEKRELVYNEQVYDITFGDCPRRDTKEYACWRVGRKFYYDFATCGFLSVCDSRPYGGMVHCRPEILNDIDNLLNTKLSQEWMLSHKPYEVTAKVEGGKIIFDGSDESTEQEKVLYYLTHAYDTAFGYPSEVLLLLKDNIEISPEDIIDIKPMQCWKR